MKKRKTVRKYGLKEVLSITMGYIFVPQEKVIEIVEHTTGEKAGDSPLALLTAMTKIYLLGKFPELSQFDFYDLADVINGSKDVEQNRKRFDSWLKKYVDDKKVSKKYRIRTMSSKIYAEILTQIISEHRQG